MVTLFRVLYEMSYPRVLLLEWGGTDQGSSSSFFTMLKKSEANRGFIAFEFT